jgi:S1-C subfamily serine protease
MNTTGLSRRSDLTIPTTTVHRVVSQLMEKGRIARGYLGVGMQPVRLPERLKTSLNLPESTAVIMVSLETNGPADQAGVLLGDVLIRFDGIPITDTADVLSHLTEERVGQTVILHLIRAGSLIELPILVGDRPWAGE